MLHHMAKGIKVADVIEVKDFEMGRFFWIIRVDPNHHVNP